MGFHYRSIGCHSHSQNFDLLLCPLSIYIQIGPNGYYFAIDPNGYVLLHPNLQPKVCPLPSEHYSLWHMSRRVTLRRFIPHGCAITARSRWIICMLADGAGSFQTFPCAVASSIFMKRIHFPVRARLDTISPQMSARRSLITMQDKIEM